MNNINLIGRISNDLKLEITNTNKAYLKFNIAVRRDKENTDFINCIAWNKTANIIDEYCGKGKVIGVSGSLRVDNYEKNNEKRKNIYVLVNTISLIDNKKNEKQNLNIEEVTEDEFPF